MSDGREMTFEDVLRFAAGEAIRPGVEGTAADDPGPAPAPSSGGCGSGSCGCRGESAPQAVPPAVLPGHPPTQAGTRGGSPGAPRDGRGNGEPKRGGGNTILEKPVDRRGALGMIFGGMAAGAGAVSACSPASLASQDVREARLLEWEEYLKGNFRLMTDDDKSETIRRLERLSEIRRGVSVNIESTPAQPNVVYGYAFNISKCQGYRNCVEACVQENNLDRETGAQYIRIFEMHNGLSVDDVEHGDATFDHEVPAAGHFYLGTQCFQCANPPCVEVCPVGATWQEPDGITVVDYDWCIGCRYCMAACPYWARRFNWSEPEVPARELNPNQHYLGNRVRKDGVVEKCTFCIQRTRQGRLPACAEACPTGARVFGNLLDPNSEIRWVIENKRVFRLKEDLETEPRFWYFMD